MNATIAEKLMLRKYVAAARKFDIVQESAKLKIGQSIKRNYKDSETTADKQKRAKSFPSRSIGQAISLLLPCSSYHFISPHLQHYASNIPSWTK